MLDLVVRDGHLVHGLHLRLLLLLCLTLLFILGDGIGRVKFITRTKNPRDTP
jgi:hypothetical protein